MRKSVNCKWMQRKGEAITCICIGKESLLRVLTLWLVICLICFQTVLVSAAVQGNTGMKFNLASHLTAMSSFDLIFPFWLSGGRRLPNNRCGHGCDQ